MVAIWSPLFFTCIWCFGQALQTNALAGEVDPLGTNNSPTHDNATSDQESLPLSIPETLLNEGLSSQQDSGVVNEGQQAAPEGTPIVQEPLIAPTVAPLLYKDLYTSGTQGDGEHTESGVTHGTVQPAEENRSPTANGSTTGGDETSQVVTNPQGNAQEEVVKQEEQTPSVTTEAAASSEETTAAAAPSDVVQTPTEQDKTDTPYTNVETPKSQVPPPIGDTYDSKDMQKDGDATQVELSDVLESGKEKISKLTMGIDQDWLNKERAVESIQQKMPTGTGFSYNRTAKILTPVVSQPKVMGGVLQTLIDKEAEIRRRHEWGVQIEHDLKLRVTKETAEVVGLLTNGSIEELKKKHPLVFTRLVEPLKTSIALAQLNKTVDQITQTYDKNWYMKSNPNDKAQLLANIRKDTARPDLFLSKIKKPKEMTEDKRKVYEVLDGFYNDYQCQKIVRGNQVAKQILRMFDEQSGLYVAPFYTDVVPTLGSLWMIARFERFFKHSESLRADVLAKSLPQMVGRFMVMVENGTVLPTSSELQVTLYSLSAVLSRIMDGETEPRTFLGKKKYYGFMGLCGPDCAKGIISNLPNGDPTKSFVLNKQREILRWISLYLRDDLMKIDTMSQKLLLELMFRTTNDHRFLPSYKSVELHLTSEYDKKPKSLLEIPNPLPAPLSVSKAKTALSALKQPTQNNVDHLVKRFLSGYRQFGKMVDNSFESNGIIPYNAFKTPNKVVASLDDGLLNMIEVVTDVINLSISSEANNLYLQAFNTWVQLQAYYNAIHAFEPVSSKTKNSSKTMGAVFRFLNTNINGHIQSIPKQFLPYTSLILQMSFFLQNSVEGYERSKAGAVKNLLKSLRTLSLRGKLGPKNFDQLYTYFQPQVIYNKAKYRISRSIVGDLVKRFKGMFLAKPAIPTAIIQLITVFLGQWAKGSHQVLEFTNPAIDRVRKSFFLSYLSNRSGMAEVGTDIIMKYCGPVTDVLSLGCVSRYGMKNTSCKQVSVKVKKSEVLKVMQLLDATFNDPLDIIRVGSDTARRCVAKSGASKHKHNRSKSGTHHSDRMMIFSEISQRYHCYSAQKMIANQLLKALLNNKGSSDTANIINQVFSSMRTITIKPSDTREKDQKLICPFMDDAPQEIRESHRQRILDYVKNKLNLKKKVTNIVRNAIKWLSKEPAFGPVNVAPLNELPGCVLVGTRKYDGIMFYAGYAPPEKIPIPDGVTLKPGDGRLVYDGTDFVSELDVLNASTAITAITMEKKNGITRRIYHLESGNRLDELQFGLEANDFIVKAHVLTTAGALSKMGYTIGRFIWCGYEHGWVADFALHDIIANTDMPIFNGKYWVLSKLLSVGDVIGTNVNIKNGDQIRDKSIGDINVDVYSGDGSKIAKYPSKVEDASSFIQNGADATFTFDTGYGEVSPAAIQDLIRNAEFDAASNTLVINLDAPGAVLQASPIIART